MGMPLPLAMGLWIVIGLGVLAVIVIGLVRRGRDGVEDIPELDAVPLDPAELGRALTGPIEATYVSTTRSGDWLARIGAFGLGNRSQAIVQVWEHGVTVERLGERDLFLPREQIRGIAVAGGMAGKFVAHDGLDVLTWQVSSDGLVVDTGLRLHRSAERADLRVAVAALLDLESTTPTTKESA